MKLSVSLLMKESCYNADKTDLTLHYYLKRLIQCQKLFHIENFFQRIRCLWFIFLCNLNYLDLNQYILVWTLTKHWGQFATSDTISSKKASRISYVSHLLSNLYYYSLISQCLLADRSVNIIGDHIKSFINVLDFWAPVLMHLLKRL